MTGSQNLYWESRGGDEYFLRNRSGQEDAATKHPSIRLLTSWASDGLPPVGRAAVLGGAGGREAAGLQCHLPDWNISNVDISPDAIEFGRTAFPSIDHHCMNIASDSPRLPEAIGENDLVFVVGVLLWIDRGVLSRAIANIDESLRDGGLLLLADFLPPTRRKNPIRHAPEYFTFKQDYSKAFLSLGTYETVCIETRLEPQPENIDEHERRMATHLLRKNLYGLYPIGYTG